MNFRNPYESKEFVYFSCISVTSLHKQVKDITKFLCQELSSISQEIRRFEMALNHDESKREFIDKFLEKLKIKNMKCQT